MKAVVIYGSTTGNTEELAGYVVEGLEQGEADVSLKNVTDIEMEELADYELIVLGCSTWGEGELQEDFIDFYESMTEEVFENKKVAVFGLGDSEMYPDTFCEAVDLLEQKLKECKAKVVIDGLKIDGDVDDALEDASSWSRKLIDS